MILVTNLDRVVSVGEKDSSMTQQDFALGELYPLLGFFGLADSEQIIKLGMVVVSPSCVPGAAVEVQ